MTAGPTHRSAVASALADAFFNDPVMSWLVPTPRRRPAALEAFFALDASHVLTHPDSLVIDEGDAVAGAALILPPGHWQMPLGQQVSQAPRLAGIFRLRLARALAFVTMLEREHWSEPHYYLPFIGIRPDRQGRGLGSRLLAELASRCDREGLPAYLEATSPENARLYERHGFATLKRASVWGSPPTELMLRTPASGA